MELEGIVAAMPPNLRGVLQLRDPIELCTQVPLNRAFCRASPPDHVDYA